MTRPRCFLELPAGLAAVSLRLHGGPGCRPPISRMGNKAGYAETILWTLGLRAGHGADAYLWAEADPDVAALLRCYPDAAMLRAVADIIRGWKDEEPRALWERLRAERKARGPRVDAEGTAGWMTIVRSSAKPGAETSGFCTHAGRDEQPPRDIGTVADRCDTLAEHADVARWTFIQGHESPNGRLAAQYRNPEGTADGSWAAPPREWLTDRVTRLAEYAQIASANRLINVAGPDLRNTGKGGTTFGGAEFATPAGELADRFEAAAVAGAAFLHQGSFQHKGVDAGIGRPEGIPEAYANHGAVRPVADVLSDAFPRLAGGWPPVTVISRIPAAADVAIWLGTPGDLSGCVVYMDPPYVDTTGYQHALPRAEVVSIAIEYASMGAHVAISEAVPLPELVALGWHVADITAGRRGQKRTFSKQQGEYLTMNRPAAYTIPTQVGMFGAKESA